MEEISPLWEIIAQKIRDKEEEMKEWIKSDSSELPIKKLTPF